MVLNFFKKLLLYIFVNKNVEKKIKSLKNMYNCFDIAKKILKLAKKEGYSVETMKLLKLTYIIHGWYLAFFDRPLFENRIEAWQYGPVIPDLYHVIKRFGTNNVDINVIKLYSENKLEEEDSKFVKVIWNAYKKFNGLQLSSKTHNINTPWHKTYDGTFHKVIENHIIKEYYKELRSSHQNA